MIAAICVVLGSSCSGGARPVPAPVSDLVHRLVEPGARCGRSRARRPWIPQGGSASSATSPDLDHRDRPGGVHPHGPGTDRRSPMTAATAVARKASQPELGA
ncbi:hypothetical protein HBB16_01405 [Pseudonocardia sp. MCCB 268]|nr:hypothetical protein [Pseudonocardia cytotoxica]